MSKKTQRQTGKKELEEAISKRKKKSSLKRDIALKKLDEIKYQKSLYGLTGES